MVGLESLGPLGGGTFGGFQSGKAGGDVGLVSGPGLETGPWFSLCRRGPGGPAVGCDKPGVGAAHEEGIALPLELHPRPESLFDLVQPHRRDVAPRSYVVGVDGD